MFRPKPIIGFLPSKCHQMKDLVPLILAKLIWIFKSVIYNFFWARLRNTSVHFKENLPPGAFLTSFAHIKPPSNQKYATKSMPKCSSHHSESNGVPNFPYKIFLCPGKLQTHPNAEPPSNHTQNTRTKQHQTHAKHTHKTTPNTPAATAYSFEATTDKQCPATNSYSMTRRQKRSLGRVGLRKADYVKALENEFAFNWGKYEDFFSKLEVDNATT